MKVIGKRDVAGADGEPADAVAEAMAAARAREGGGREGGERTNGGWRTNFFERRDGRTRIIDHDGWRYRGADGGY